MTNTKRKALLIIDMQKGSFTPETPRWDTDGVVQRINQLASWCRKQHFPVFVIQHDGSREHVFLPGTEEWEVLDTLELTPHDLRVSKTANDSFYQTGLETRLRSLRIEELLITGCATDFCVEATVQGAITRDFSVTVVADGHTTADRPHATAQQVIDHYNWVWSELTPTGGTIRVCEAGDLVSD